MRHFPKEKRRQGNVRSVAASLHFAQAPLFEELLEVDFQRHLENSRIVGRGDLSKIAVRKSKIGVAEVNVVEGRKVSKGARWV